jgi:hypothetical protein
MDWANIRGYCAGHLREQPDDEPTICRAMCDVIRRYEWREKRE